LKQPLLIQGLRRSVLLTLARLKLLANGGIVTTKFERDQAGFLRVTPLPDKSDLAAYYASDYYQNPHGTYSQEYSAEEIEHKRIRCNFIFRVATESFDESGSFLDVGCGEGFLLDSFQSRGWKSLGLDFSRFGIEKFNPHLVSSFIEGDIYDSLDLYKSQKIEFDCVNLGNVLEHVLDPLALLNSIAFLLSKKGVLVITVPNDFSQLQLMLAEIGAIADRYWIKIPDHLNYFSYQSLWSLVSQSGLVPIDVFADFPIEWFLANESSNYSKNKAVGTFAHSARVKLDSFITDQEDFEAVKNFWSAMAKVGQGRTITLLCQKLNNS
jgi:SAM-dependent methyltransferase